MNLSIIQRMVASGDISLDALRYLLQCRGECEWLDYKEELLLDPEKPACDFAKDILGMKNTGGGYLVIGVKDKTWNPIGIPHQLPYDAKLLRDKVRKCTGLDLEVYVVHHSVVLEGIPRLFALIYVKASQKRTRRRLPSLVTHDFASSKPYGFRRGDIFVRKGDSTVRLDSTDELEGLLDALEDQADRDAIELGSKASPFAVEDGTYRLLEKGFDSFIGRDQLRKQILTDLLTAARPKQHLS